MFKDMDRWVEIRRRVLTKELSKRGACKEYDLEWRTLQRILKHEEPAGYQMKEPRQKRKLAAFLPIIHEILEQDRQAPKKQRHTAQRIFDRLRTEHQYDGGLTIVKDAVRAWKQRQAEVFVPLAHRPGEAQVDFGEAQVRLRGEQVQVALFVMTLPYSDAIFCQVFPRECTETFQEGHKRAFEFFGGVPRRISYDNSKIAVAKITGGRGREVTREFLRLASHYLFEHHFCLVRRPNEKGHVENLIGYARRNYLVPIPEIDSLEGLNVELEQRCRQDLSRTLRGKSATKEELLAAEQTWFLAPALQEFEARRVKPARANSLSLVRFECNDYSVPTQYAHHDVTVIGGIEEIRLVVGDRLVARHPRHWGKEHTEFNPVHYLALLERKPGGAGLRQATGELAAARMLAGATSTPGGRTGEARHARVHQGAAAAGACHVAGAGWCRGIRAVDRGQQCRRGEVDSPVATRAARPSVLPGRASSSAGSACSAAESAGVSLPVRGGLRP